MTIKIYTRVGEHLTRLGESLTLTLDVGRAIPLAEVNAKLEPFGVLLVVSHWDGQGERDPTTLEVMSPEEHARRCEATKAGGRR